MRDGRTDRRSETNIPPNNLGVRGYNNLKLSNAGYITQEFMAFIFPLNKFEYYTFKLKNISPRNQSVKDNPCLHASCKSHNRGTAIKCGDASKRQTDPFDYMKWL